jgi:hypothetical protein
MVSEIEANEALELAEKIVHNIVDLVKVETEDDSEPVNSGKLSYKGKNYDETK